MKIYCVRHTRVDIPEGVCYGQSDIGLKDTYGQEKAKILLSLNGLEFDKIYSSPLFRCRKLAEDLFPANKIIFDDRLKELDFGDWELKTWNEVYGNPEGKAWMDNYLEAPCPCGESYKELRQRVNEFYMEISERNFRQIAIVTHAGVIRLLKSIVEQLPVEVLFRDFKPGFGEIVQLNSDLIQ